MHNCRFIKDDVPTGNHLVSRREPHLVGLGRQRVANKDALDRPGSQLAGTLLVDVDGTAPNTETCKVGVDASPQCDWWKITVALGCPRNQHVTYKSSRRSCLSPKSDRQVGLNEEGTYHVAQRPIDALSNAVLLRGTGGRDLMMNTVLAKIVKE